eukprot:m.33514 g.33514  ORF g.33514 m.33514 type:complete len:54 (+) comp9635_c0_seq1:1554-1715(+)
MSSIATTTQGHSKVTQAKLDTSISLNRSHSLQLSLPTRAPPGFGAKHWSLARF